MRATTMPPTLGDRLGDVMWERKHTPDDVAALIGADPTDIDRWAGDRLTPGPGEFAALAGYLEVDVDAVCDGVRTIVGAVGGTCSAQLARLSPPGPARLGSARPAPSGPHGRLVVQEVDQHVVAKFAGCRGEGPALVDPG